MIYAEWYIDQSVRQLRDECSSAHTRYVREPGRIRKQERAATTRRRLAFEVRLSSPGAGAPSGTRILHAV